jgi:hypothetical protein
MKNKKIKFKGVLITIGVLLAVFGLFFLFRESEKFSEFVAQNLTRRVSDAMGKFTSKFTFSFLEVGVIVLAVSLIVLLGFAIEGLRRKKFKGVLKGLLIVLTVIIGGVDFYMLTAGAAYYRAPIALPIYGDFDERYGADEVQHAAESFLFDYYTLYNKLKDEGGVVRSPYSFDELNDVLNEEFKRLDGKYFFENTPRVKAVDNVWFMDIAMIGGIAFVPFGEANIDAARTSVNYIPSLMAHEIAHIKGVMRENEAELVSAYILITSENEYLRYCGYYRYIDYLISAIRISDPYDLEYEKADAFWRRSNSVSSYVYSDWEGYSDLEKHVLIPFFRLFSGFSGYINDLYLKFNGAENGSGSYENPYDEIDTGEIVPDSEERDEDGNIIPDTGRPITKPVYSDLHKLFFAIYEEGREWLTDGIMPPEPDRYTKIVAVPVGSLYLSMGDGFIIITPENVWTLFYTTEDGINKDEIIEPLFTIDLDALPDSIKTPDEQSRNIRHGNYWIWFGGGFVTSDGGIDVIIYS